MPDASHISKAQVRKVEAWIAEALRTLDLNFWRVYVAAEEPSSDDAIAMIEPTDGRRIAMLYLSERFLTDPLSEQMETLTHEVLHLLHHDADEVIRRFFRESGDVPAYAGSLIVDQFKLELERMVDSLSYVLQPLMPEWKGFDA